MKRDLDLIRSILLDLESGTGGVLVPEKMKVKFVHEAMQPSVDILVEDCSYDLETVCFHIYLLEEVGYIEKGSYTRGHGGFYFTRVPAITWAGYEFLDNARNDSIWHAAKQKVGEKLKSSSIEVINGVLVQLSNNLLNLS
jgi:Hypothetical protein (DUF2513)